MPTIGERLHDKFVAPVKGHNMCYLDVIEADDKFMIDAAVAGFPKDKLKLTLDGRDLIIEGDSDWTDECIKGAKYKKHELSRGHFKRKIDLPNDIVAENVKAKWENGMLHLAMDRTDHKTEKANKINIPIEV